MQQGSVRVTRLPVRDRLRRASARQVQLGGIRFVLALLIGVCASADWAHARRAVQPNAEQTPTLFSWRTIDPAPLERFEAQGAVADGKLYVFGGFFTHDMATTKRVDVYDPANGRWSRLADLPEPLTHTPVVVDGATIYLVGGFVGDHPGPSTSHVWKYHIPSNTWSAGPDLPTPRGASAAVLLGRALHVFGGSNRVAGAIDHGDEADHFVLDLDRGTNWTRAAPLPNPRNHLGAAVLGGRIYAIGGQHGRDESRANQQQVDVYDPANDRWTRAAPLPEPRGHISASTIVLHNRIVVLGGTVNGGSNGLASEDVLSYDPLSDTWLDLPALPAARKSPVAGVIDGQIVVATGNAGGSQPTPTTWASRLADTWEAATDMPVALGAVTGGIIENRLYLVGANSPATLAYNLSTGRWQSSDALATRPFAGQHHAAEVIDGKLYLFGGVGDSAGKLQIYDPTNDRWTVGAAMPFAAGSSATALIGGQVYVAGGIVAGSSTAQVARYDPATDRWTMLAPQPQPRSDAAAATDGFKLYVFGGRSSGSSDSADTVQIYDPTTNSWRSSQDPGSTLAPLPQARSGMGKAIYHRGEFYLLGGARQADQVYSRVDIYNPVSNTWRHGAAMPTARHGISPVLLADRIYVAGGLKTGHAATTTVEVYNAPAPAPLAIQRYLPLIATP